MNSLNYRWISRLIVVVLALLWPAAGYAAPTTQPTAAQVRLAKAGAEAKAAVIYIEDEINDYTREDLSRRMRKAREAGAEAIIIDIDTYGGAVSSALDISRAIKQADYPIIAFVRTKAISAGALIAVARDAIYMADATLIGDAAPIMISQGGPQTLGETERAKAESPILEEFRDSARRAGYSPLLLECMVSLAKEVYWIENAAGERRLVDAEGHEKLSKEGWKPVIPERNPLDGKNALLTLDSTVAEQVGLSRGTVPSADAAAAAVGWQVTQRYKRTAGDRVVAFLSKQQVAFLLITVLSISIYVALHTPGQGFPEVLVVVCLTVLLGVPLLTGYAAWWEVLCVLLGVVLLAVEIFVLPGFGVPGITGIVLVLFGLTMTLVPPLPPGLPGILPAIELSWRPVVRALSVVTGAFAASLVISFFLGKYLPSLPFGRRLVLTATVGETLSGPGHVALEGESGGLVSVGSRGVAATDLRPGGQVLFFDPAIKGDRAVDVVCDIGFIAAGSKVIVKALRGQEVVVRAAPEEQSLKV
jgi:membrane-bound serine protease (ClpP class)